ncbi:MAG: UDP-3-O-(3-hydroxymyristoyl)glucosamine N-acyltransferase [Pseudomonadota bacterium]
MAGWTVARLAGRLGGVVEWPDGEAEVRLLSGVRPLGEAGPEHLAFLANRRYHRELAGSRAGAVLLDRDTPAAGHCAIRVADPYAAFAQAMALFHPASAARPGVHARAVVEEGARVEGAEVRALAYVGPGARVGAGTILDPGVYVGAGAMVGRDCHLMANAVVCDGCVLGDRVILNPGAVVGAEGFGFASTPNGHVKIPQAGRAVVEDDVEIGANSCVDRAALGETRLGRGSKLDNLVQIGHAAQVGEHALMVAYAAVAGSARLGRFATLAAKALVLGHLRLGEGVRVGAGSMVTRDLSDGAEVSGWPAFEHRAWRRAALALRELPEALQRLRRLERRADAGEKL